MGKRDDIKPLPSLERLNELFTYEPLTGDLRWKSIPANFHRAQVGDVAGTIGAKGYRVVGIERVYYLAHRIIWKMMTVPILSIRSITKIRTDRTIAGAIFARLRMGLTSAIADFEATIRAVPRAFAGTNHTSRGSHTSRLAMVLSA